jgi:hypothetical protein
MKNIICLCSLAVALFANVSSSIAKVDITPSVTLREEYNDNLFLTESAEEFDYITKISPGILIEYSPGSSLDLSLDYRLDFRFYSRNSKYNDTSLKDTQNVNFKAQARPLSRVFIDVFDIYKRVPIDIRRKYASGNDFQNMTESNVFTISPYITTPLSSTLSTTLGYTYNNNWYGSKENTDSESHAAFLELTNRFSSKLSGELKYDFYKYLPGEHKTSKFIEDYGKHSGSIGLTYQIGPSLTINGQAGKSYFNFETRDNKQDNFWNINADYNIKKSTSLGAGYSTTLKDSSTLGAYKSRRIDMYFKTETPIKLSINPYHSRDEYSGNDRKDTITGINANIVFPLTKKIDLLCDGLWERQKFQPKDEKVNKYSAGLSLDYKYREKLTASLGYKYDGRDSNIDTNSFTNNIIFLQAKVVF